MAYRFNKLPSTVKEEAIQRTIVSALPYFLHRSAILFHIPNGGKRKRVEAAILKGMGVLAGVADLEIVHQGRCYFMELKRPGEGQTDEQIEFERRCQDTGVPYAVVTSFEEALECVRSWGLTRAVLPESPGSEA